MTRPVHPPARKRWGQNFLVDGNYISKIIAAIGPGADEHFLEIGPGHGELTIPLARQADSVTAIDIDPWLVEDLREQAPGNVTIIEGDVLEADVEALLPEGVRVYGSLPYYITSQILFRLIDHRHRWQDGHFMVQKEVARRMVARPGRKDYGRLTVMLQAYCDVTSRFNLPPTVFRPMPKVDSSLIAVVPRAETGLDDEKVFSRVVRLAFGQRRKKLSNALKVLEAGDLLAEMGLADLRADAVSVEAFIELANRYAEKG